MRSLAHLDPAGERAVGDGDRAFRFFLREREHLGGGGYGAGMAEQFRQRRRRGARKLGRGLDLGTANDAADPVAGGAGVFQPLEHEHHGAFTGHH